MPSISVWLIRCALAHLSIGLTAGSLLMISGSWGWVLPVSALRPFHVEMLLFGWLMQLAFGVAIWILPFSRNVTSDWRLWGALLLLNVGIFLVALAALLPSSTWLLPPGRLLEICAALLFAWNCWPRLRKILPHAER